MMLKQEIEIGGLPVEIIRKSNLKNLYVRVNPPDGKVTVSSPTDVLEEEIKLLQVMLSISQNSLHMIF